MQCARSGCSLRLKISRHLNLQVGPEQLRTEDYGPILASDKHAMMGSYMVSFSTNLALSGPSGLPSEAPEAPIHHHLLSEHRGKLGVPDLQAWAAWVISTGQAQNGKPAFYDLETCEFSRALESYGESDSSRSPGTGRARPAEAAR